MKAVVSYLRFGWKTERGGKKNPEGGKRSEERIKYRYREGDHFHKATERCVRCTLPASEGGKRSEGRLMLELLGSSLFSTPIRRRFRALRVHEKKKTKKTKKTNPPSGSVQLRSRFGMARRAKVGREAGGGFGKLLANYGSSSSACFYITASSAFFFYVDASCSENMEFLKGPRTRPSACHRPRQPTVSCGRQMAFTWLMSLSRVSFDTRVNPDWTD